MSAVGLLLDRAHRGVVVDPRTVDAVQSEFDRMETASASTRLGLLLVILSRLASARMRLLSSASYKPTHIQKDHSWFARGLSILHESHERAPALDDIARRLGIGVPTFTRLFRRMSGMSYIQYVNHWRIGRSKLMLRRTDESVLNVAMSTGYTNLSHFNRQFLRIAGMPPREYRRRHAGS